MTTQPDYPFPAWLGAPWEPRPWQREALPRVLEAISSDKRAIVSAFMGSGKSILQAEIARVALPVLEYNQAIVIGAPTRKLVRQLGGTVSRRVGGLNLGAYYTDSKESTQPIVVTCYASAVALAAELRAQRREVALFIADECHQTESQTVLEAFEALDPARAVGFTATPFRASRSEKLSLWDEIVYSYTFQDARRDEVVTGFRVLNWDGLGEPDTDAICVRMITDQTEGPGIVSAMSIADAGAYAALLTRCGVPALEIHSELSQREQDRRIGQLREGTIRALVHVSLLSEGVDLPWLRWICLRRPVGSVVRFVQELGRVLRCHPGKGDAVVIDPHDLMGKHGIHHAARLSDAKLYGNPRGPRDREEGEEGSGEPPIMPKAVAVGNVVGWLRKICNAMEESGIPGRERFGGSWEDRPPSDRQIETLGKLTWQLKRLPAELRAELVKLCHPVAARAMDRAAVSELLTILMMLADDRRAARQQGRPPTQLSFPENLVAPKVAIGRVQQEGQQRAVEPRPGPVDNEHPRASRDWLEGLPTDHRRMASGLFSRAIRDGAETPRDVCRGVYRRLRERIASETDPRLVAIRNHLVAHLQGAMAFAVDRIRWASMSERERHEYRAACAAGAL